jgi:hypothetical protein
MSVQDDRALAEDVLVSALDDLVYAAWVLQIARRSGLSEASQLRQLVVGLVAELLLDGLVVAGDVFDGVHQAWACTVQDAVVRIVRDWRDWGDERLTPGAIFWLALTPAGQSAAEAVQQRERSQT